MDDDIDEIDDGPAALLHAGLSEDLEVVFFTELSDFAGDRADLLTAGAGADDKKQGDGAAIGEFEDDYVPTVSVVG